MGKIRFSRVLKFALLAAAALAASFLAAIVSASPAAARDGDGDGQVEVRKWDTDNLKIGTTYTARSFAIPHYSSGATDAANARQATFTIGTITITLGNVSPCQPAVMDGFFQNLASQPRNDLPRLEKTSGVWGETTRHPCSSFAWWQDRAISIAGLNGGYWLDSGGNLKQGGFGSWMTAARDYSVSLGYTTWAGKGAGYSVVRVGRNDQQQTQAVAPSASDEGYIARVDYAGTGGRTVGAPSGGLSLPDPPVRQGYIVDGSSPIAFRASYPTGSRHLPHAKSVGGPHPGSWCPAGSHPRGEDALWKIGSGTGRTLSSLTGWAATRLADLFWCRSDVRYPIRYAPNSITGTTCGTSGAPSCPSGVVIPTGNFTAWGRVNCYYTALSIDSNGKCEYPHPVPLCTDSDTGTPRNYTQAELDTYTTDTVPFPAEDDGTTTCAPAPADPPPQEPEPPALATFAADPCVTADIEIYENRPAGKDAEPGVPVSDRTLAVSADRTAWDLDITSAHPRTASPSRDATAGTGDPDGCADGSENRADHASTPGGTARAQNPAPAYAASLRTDTAAPPNDADGDIDYTGAAANMAHRYASAVAENTCAAKRAEAEMMLSAMRARRLSFKRYIDIYQARLDAALSPTGSPATFGNWSANTQTGTGLGVKVLEYNAIEAEYSRYVSDRKTRLEGLRTAVGEAETEYDTDTGSLSIPATVPDSGCVAAYDTAIDDLEDTMDDAEADFSSNIRTGSRSVSGHLAYFEATRQPVIPSPARVVVPSVAKPPSSWTDGESSDPVYSCAGGGTVGADRRCTRREGSLAIPSTSTTQVADQNCLDNPPDPLVFLWETACYSTQTVTTYSCPDGADLVGEWCWQDSAPFPSTKLVTTPQSYSVEAWGTVNGYFPASETSPTKSQRFKVTFTGSRTKTVINDGSPTYSPALEGSDYATTSAAAELIVRGSPPRYQSGLPGFAAPAATARPPLPTSWLLGSYHPQHTARTLLTASAADDRDTAAEDLGVLSAGNATTPASGGSPTPQSVAAIHVPTAWTETDTPGSTARRADLQTEANDYKTAYAAAYDAAYTQATGHMSGTSWESFDWRYQASTLGWGDYAEDGATTFSASTETPRDGTGCDLIAVNSSDGTVTVEATRLDFETSEYGNGTVFGTRTVPQRTCKIMRTRTPELLLMYAPGAPTGTDTSKILDARLDSDSTASHAEFFYVDYQPASTDERFTLYDEAEVFAVRAGLADTAPTYCWAPGTMRISHAAEGRRAGPPQVPGAFLMVSGVPSPRQVRGNTLTQTITVKTGGTDVPTAVYHDVCDSAAQPAVSVLGSGWKAYDDTAHSRLATVAASNVPCAGGTATVQQYLPTGHGLAYFNDGSWRYRTGEGDTPTGWRVGEDGLTLQSLPFSYMNATDGSGNRTCVPVALRLIDCSVSAEDVAFLQDIEQLANVSARQEPGDKLDIAAALWAHSDPANLMGTALTDVRGWYYPPYREYKNETPEREYSPGGDRSHSHPSGADHTHRAFPENSDGDPSYNRDSHGRVPHPVLAQPRGSSTPPDGTPRTR